MKAARELRLRYQYHDLVLRGRVRISLEAAENLFGPDRAYHLHGLVPPQPRLRPRQFSCIGKYAAE